MLVSASGDSGGRSATRVRSTLLTVAGNHFVPPHLVEGASSASSCLSSASRTLPSSSLHRVHRRSPSGGTSRNPLEQPLELALTQHLSSGRNRRHSLLLERGVEGSAYGLECRSLARAPKNGGPVTSPA